MDGTNRHKTASVVSIKAHFSRLIFLIKSQKFELGKQKALKHSRENRSIHY